MKNDHAKLCLCLTGSTLQADLDAAGELGRHSDMLELRADFLDASQIGLAGRLPGLVGLPVILTVRRLAEGGLWAGGEPERIALLRSLASAGFAYVDLEEDLDSSDLDRLFAASGTRIIRSFHDFSGIPDDLAGRIRRLPHGKNELPKAAVMPRSAADLLRLIEAARSLSGPRILLGMGEYGFCTRVLAARLGSFLCYSSPPDAQAAPGQTDPRTLDELYRFRSIGRDTVVYGVIGDPIMHSLSPLIHNRGLAAAGLDAVYLPFRVDNLEPFLEAATALGVSGLSVTIPHKQAVIPLLARRDGLVEAIGACNTMIRSPKDESHDGRWGDLSGTREHAFGERVIPGIGRWTGTNTDAEGFLAPLREAFGGSLPRGLGATVIGAGGASRAIIHALVSHGARVLVLNRGVERARDLARTFPLSVAGLDDDGFRQAGAFSDLVVQTTSVGMFPRCGEDPAPAFHFRGSEMVFDIVYNPRETTFLGRARQAGCRVIPGYRMFIAQACEQFRLFTGKSYPEGLKREMEEQLADVHRE